MTNPPYLQELMRVRAARHPSVVRSRREALAEAITEHNRRVRSEGATRVP